MKLKLVTMMIAMVAFSAINVRAQVPDESRIKVLNTEKPGVLKLVHALQIEDGVTVNFITDEGIISTDEIKGSYPKGMSKRYDVRKIDKDFWMEVSTPRLSVTYHIIPSSDGKTFTSNLEKAVHKYDVIVASRE
ncbi:MAG TPA: hypothetical protein VK589_14480 [Chryseolinea sp.]|nr:hypothetical protein [Chryseolinea sp.]